MPSVFAPGDPAGAETLEIMAAAPRFNAWMFEVVAPYIGRRVLEVGSGIGNLSEQILAGGRDRVILTDIDPWYRARLTERFGSRPEVRIEELVLPDSSAGSRFRGDRLDTVIALNVVEHIEDDVGALGSIREILAPGGRAVILVPALEALYGELDREVGHCRRYTRRTLRAAFERAGFRVGRLFWFNRVGTLGWWFNGRVRKVRRIPIDQLRRFDALVPLLRLERLLPLPFGQSLIGIGHPA